MSLQHSFFELNDIIRDLVCRMPYDPDMLWREKCTQLLTLYGRCNLL